MTTDPGATSGPWTFAGAEDAHPNGTNSTPNEEHWVLRRWEATTSTPAELELRSHIRKTNPNCGDGTSVNLYQNGNLLNAVQYILNRLFSDAIGKKIYCECERFRKNREYELSNLAHRYARTVRKSGKSINLKELNPFERRIVHMTINKYSDLESKSAGDSFQKVITIRKK